MKKTSFCILLCSILACLLVSSPVHAQIRPNVIMPSQPPAQPGPISGPTSVQAGQTATYSVTTVSGATSYSWSLSSIAAGTISGTGTSATVHWSATYSGPAQVYCSAVNSYGSSAPSILSVSVSSGPLTSGVISPASQTITYNTVPAAMTCTAASGGGGGYSYQWQSSVNNSTWTTVSGAAGLSYSPAALTVTTWYRLVTYDMGESSVTSNPAVVTVNGAPASNADTTFNLR